MKTLGGYFELELRKGDHYHKTAIKLNTGRNAFEYLLRAKQYQKVYMPYFTCDVMLEPIKKLQSTHEKTNPLYSRGFKVCAEGVTHNIL